MADPVVAPPAAPPVGDPATPPAAPPVAVLGNIDPATPPAAPPAAPPADVTYEFKFADGLNLDDTVKGEFTTWAKDNKLEPKAAQGAADLASKTVEQVAERHMSQIVELYTKWATDSKADAEFGGEKFGENMNVANEVLKQFGTPELTKVLQDTGLGNHPEVIRVFYKVGKLISQDSVAGAIAQAASAGKTDAQKMYGG